MGMVGDEERTAVILGQHPLWLDALHQLLDRNGFDVVGKTSVAREAVAIVREYGVDLLLMELEFFDGEATGLSTLKLVKEANPAVKSVVLSAYEDGLHIGEAFSAGATAYCAKRTAPEDIAAAVRQVLDPCVYFAAGLPAVSGNDFGGPLLTQREREILRLLADGRSNAQLAKLLWITEQTVKFHLTNIYRKLDVGNRTEAARWAQLHGLLDPAPVESAVA